MQQHREVEQHREREARDVLPAAQAGLDLVDRRGEHTEISAATSSHDERTRTSTPPIWPILRCRARAGAPVDAVSAGSPGLRCAGPPPDAIAVSGPDADLSARSPSVTVRREGRVRVVQAPRRRTRRREDPRHGGGAHRRRRRRRARLAVPEPGGRLHEPARCCSASARSTGCRSRPHPTPCAARWCTRCSRTSSTCPRPTAPPTGPPTCWCPRGSRSSRPSPRSPRCSAPRVPRSAPGWRPARSRCGRYFALEDPTRLEPAERELYVETLLDSKLLLRGFVDRLDIAPTGEIRVVDYKTGKAPHEAYEAKALFQMKFYALVVWRTRGVVPADAAADLPRQRRGAALRPRRARPARHRAQGRGALGGDRHRPGDRRLAAARAGSAAGAPTRRSAPRGAAPRPLPRAGPALPRALPAREPTGAADRRRSPPSDTDSRLRSAHSAAWVRSATPMRWNTEVRCALTVRSLIPSRRAICLLASPARTRRAPRSRAGSATDGRGASLRARTAAGGRPAGAAATRRG